MQLEQISCVSFAYVTLELALGEKSFCRFNSYFVMLVWLLARYFKATHLCIKINVLATQSLNLIMILHLQHDVNFI